MKKLILSLLAIAALALNAEAQQYRATSLTLATNQVAASATESGDSSAITLTKHDNVAVLLSIQGSHAADTANVTVTFKSSVDGITYSTAGNRTIIVAVDGVNPVTYATNWTVGNVGYLMVDSVQNAATNAVTNITVTYSLKYKKAG